MDKNIRILLGLISGIVLIYLNNPQLQEMALGSLRGYFTQFLFGLLSFIGLILVIYFSYLLILDAFKAIFRK